MIIIILCNEAEGHRSACKDGGANDSKFVYFLYMETQSCDQWSEVIGKQKVIGHGFQYYLDG